MHDRIKEIRKDNNVNQEAFAESLGLSRNMVAQVETSKAIFSDRTIRDICRIYNVNEDWLRNGSGEKYVPQSDNQKLLAYINKIAGEEDSSIRRILIRIASLSASDIEIVEQAIDLIIGNK